MRCYLMIAGLLVVSTGVAFASQPPRPIIPATYTSTALLTTLINGGVKTGSGTVEANDKLQRQGYTFNFQLFGNNSMNVSHFCDGMSKTDAEIMSGQCRVHQRNESCYSNWWDFIPFATFLGNRTLKDGAQCNKWGLSHEGRNFSVCVDLADANIPLEFSISQYNGILRQVQPTAFRFLTFKPKVSVVIEMPASCVTTPYSCAPGPVVDKKVWRLHSPTDYSLTNKNVADLTGDAVFVCIFINENNVDFLQNSLFSAFDVTVNTTWGQYQLCNVNPVTGKYECFGAAGQPSQVGREAAFAAAPNSGQCTPEDPDIGVWYSFSASANTPAGWMEKRRVKSVNATCLLSQKLKAACNSYPFTSAGDAMQEAFDNCADVPPPTAPPAAERTGLAGLGQLRSAAEAADKVFHPQTAGTAELLVRSFPNWHEIFRWEGKN